MRSVGVHTPPHSHTKWPPTPWQTGITEIRRANLWRALETIIRNQINRTIRESQNLRAGQAKPEITTDKITRIGWMA